MGETASLFGPSKSNKSTTARQLAVRVAAGLDWYGRELRQGKVCYICAEDSLEAVKNGIRAYCRRMRLTPEQQRVVLENLYFVEAR